MLNIYIFLTLLIFYSFKKRRHYDIMSQITAPTLLYKGINTAKIKQQTFQAWENGKYLTTDYRQIQYTEGTWGMGLLILRPHANCADDIN